MVSCLMRVVLVFKRREPLGQIVSHLRGHNLGFVESVMDIELKLRSLNSLGELIAACFGGILLGCKKHAGVIKGLEYGVLRTNFLLVSLLLILIILFFINLLQFVKELLLGPWGHFNDSTVLVRQREI